MAALVDTESDFETTVEEDRQFVHAHVAKKTVQAGAVLALPVYAAISLFRRRPMTLAGVLRGSARGAFVVGAPLGLAMSVGRLWSEPGYAIQDRAFRLRESASQNRVDRFSGYGALAGAAAVSLVPAARTASLLHRVAGGAALGILGGVAAHLAYTEREGGPQQVKAEIEGSLPVKAVEEKMKR